MSGSREVIRIPVTFNGTFSAVDPMVLIGKSSASGGQYWIVPEDEIVLHGDVDVSGTIDIDDAVGLISVIFLGGSIPGPFLIADCDCSNTVDIDDIVCLVNYIFLQGPFPCNS